MADLPKMRKSLFTSEYRELEIYSFFEAAEDSNSPVHKQLNNFKDKLFTVKDTEMTYRTLNHWVEVGLLDDDREKSGQGWRKFSYYDRLWIEVLLELRQYGLSLDKTRKIKEDIFDKKIGKTKYNYFEYGLMRCVFNKKSQTYLVVFNNGEADIVSKHDLNAAEILFQNESYLLINLNKTLRRLTPKESKIFDSDYEMSVVLSDKEKELMFALRLEKLDELLVKFDEHGEMKMFEKVRKLTAKDKGFDVAKDLKYGSILQKNQNGECYLLEIREKQKLD